MARYPPLWTRAMGIWETCLLGPLCQRHMHRGPSSAATPTSSGNLDQPLPPLGPSFTCAVRRLWAWMIAQLLPTSTLIAAFIELQLSVEWCLGCGRGGPHSGRRGQPEPAASSWPGEGRAQSATHPPPQQNLVPGAGARLRFEMSPVGGTLAWFRCSGLKIYWFVRENVLVPSFH